jgi:uncharacterized coiled-coil protein SlyX
MSEPTNEERLALATKTIIELSANLAKATEIIHQQEGQLGIANGVIKFLAQFIRDNGFEPPALPELVPPKSDLQD